MTAIRNHLSIQIDPIGYTEVLVSGPEAICKWREANRIEVPGAEYIQQYVRRRWGKQTEPKTWAPGKWCRIRSAETANIEAMYELRCSRGVLPRLLEALGCTVYTAVPADVSMVAHYIGGQPKWQELRDYQQAAFMAVVEQEWGRIAFATNAGKGAVLALLADFAWTQSISVLILCDEKAVYDALQGELRTWAEIEPYLVKAGTQEPPPPGITLAMIPTLAKRLTDDPDLWKPWLQAQGMLLLDEADKATAATWRALCLAATNTRWRVGFSGTFPKALTYEDWLLEDLMGPILLRASNRELVDRGISAKPLIELHGFDATAALYPLLTWDDWRAAGAPGRRLWVFERAIVYNTMRHTMITQLIRPGVPTAIVVNRLDHGEQLQAAIPGSVFLDGSWGEGDRLAALEQFRAGKFPILIVTKILDRGTNRLGFAQDVIFASGEGSNRQTLQRMGRGLRRTDGKTTLRLVDIIDHVTAVDGDDRRLTKAADFLHEAGRKRHALYTAEGFDLEVIPA